jgi:hypothetical protein
VPLDELLGNRAMELPIKSKVCSYCKEADEHDEYCDTCGGCHRCCDSDQHCDNCGNSLAICLTIQGCPGPTDHPK